MKFPKLKHTFWCKLIYCLPMIIMLIAIITAAVLLETEKISGELFAIILISLPILNLIWLINGIGTAMRIDMISRQRKVRRWYYCSKNGTDAASIKSNILKRVERFGKEQEPLESHMAPVIIKQRTELSRRRYQNYRYTYIALVYETDFLTQDIYKEIMRSASANSLALSNTLKNDKNRLLSPVETSHTAIIFADYIADDVIDIVHNDSLNNSKPLACVVELNTGRYFVDITAPSKNLSLVKKLVFGGNISNKGNDNFMPCPEFIEELSETSFWKSLKENGNGLFGASSERKRQRALDNLNSGEVMIYNEDIYVKIGQRIACLITTVNENDPDTLVVFLEKEPFWDKPFGETIRKRDIDDIIKRVENFLNEQGTRYRFVDPDEEE